MPSTLNDIEVAIEAARRGAAILLKYWENIGKEQADIKARNDWVSAADRESEAAINEFLAQERPDDATLGEETGSSGTSANGRCWIIDPLDGTSNYLQHFPVWSVSIALRKNKETVVGLIYEPLRDIFFSAERGAGAFRNDARMRVSDQEQVDGSFLATGFPFRAQEYVDAYVAI